MKDYELSRVELGDVLIHVPTGETWIVIERGHSYPIAIRTTAVAQPREWDYPAVLQAKGPVRVKAQTVEVLTRLLHELEGGR